MVSFSVHLYCMDNLSLVKHNKFLNLTISEFCESDFLLIIKNYSKIQKVELTCLIFSYFN